MTYSIIIPHKNCPELLGRLIDSIPIRDDTEIIIVDDHSETSVVDFNNLPGKGRNNLNYILLDDSYGAGYARNIGIENAHGKWLLFADADDYYCTEKLDRILNKYSKDDETELIILNSKVVDINGTISEHSINMYIENYEKNRFYSEKVVRYQIWTPWSRMVKRDFVNKHQLRYEEIPVGNDVMFCLRCSQYALKIKVEKEIVYYYFRPCGRSVTNSYYNNIRTMELRIDKAFRQHALYNEVNYIFKPCHLLETIFSSNKRVYGKEYVKKYQEYLSRYKYSYIKDFWYLILLYVGRLLRII